MSTYVIQPATKIDGLTSDGEEMTQKPYPFVVEEDGSITNLHGYKRLVGFAKDLAVEQVDLYWELARRDITGALGMYVVTEDDKGTYAVHLTAVETVEKLEVRT